MERDSLCAAWVPHGWQVEGTLTIFMVPLWLPILALRMAGPAAGMYCTKTNLARFDVVFWETAGKRHAASQGQNSTAGPFSSRPTNLAVVHCRALEAAPREPLP
jgi:hypothetical protein